MKREPFGRTPTGDTVERITLKNARGAELRAMTYGAIITELRMPDRDDRLVDVVLGCDSLDGYLRSSFYFGAVVGRYANRIAHGRFRLGGRFYELATNDGPHHLHGGRRGFDRIVWNATTFAEEAASGVRFRCVSPDGDEGYPGELATEVTYTLTDTNEVVIEYEATTDRPTPVNLTQHSYFNLAGGGDILGHELTLAAHHFTPIDATSIPTGRAFPVAGTPLDFTTARAIGERIDADDEQLRFGHGYDHNFVLARSVDGLAFAARLHDPSSGRTLDVRTTEPGIQLYSGNHLNGSHAGKRGVVYGRRSGLSLETQHFPDSPNQATFPTTILDPGRVYRSKTVWAFTASPKTPAPAR